MNINKIFKIHENVKYTRNGNEITCTITAHLCVRDEQDYKMLALSDLLSKLLDFSHWITVTRKAVCHVDDTFDEETGRKLAYSRAKYDLLTEVHYRTHQMAYALGMLSDAFCVEAIRYDDAANRQGQLESNITKDLL